MASPVTKALPDAPSHAGFGRDNQRYPGHKDPVRAVSENDHSSMQVVTIVIMDWTYFKRVARVFAYGGLVSAAIGFFWGIM